jgi:hypothetical protein
MFCRCFTVISRISAFSNLEWRAGCNNSYKTVLVACEVGRYTLVSKHDCASVYMHFLFSLFCEQTGKDVELCLNKLIDKNEAKTYVHENVFYTRNTKNHQLK